MIIDSDLNFSLVVFHFPYCHLGQMKRALTDEMMQKFDERVQEESLNMANLTNLVRCPNCSYAAEIVDENQQVSRELVD